jgi:RimJ/RimL family protein N-acetyltransferase
MEQTSLQEPLPSSSQARISLNKDADLYTLGKLVLAPYPPQDTLAEAYLRMKSDGSLSSFFYDGIPSLAVFLQLFTMPEVLTFGAFVRRSTGETDLAGIGHVGVPCRMAGGKFSKSEVSVGYLRSFQRRTYTIPFCQMMIEWIFDRTSIDTIFGTTPERNPAMVAFIDQVGFKRTAEPIEDYASWESELCGVYVSWITARYWKTISPFRA